MLFIIGKRKSVLYNLGMWITNKQARALKQIDGWITLRYLGEGKELKAGYIEQMDGQPGKRTIMYYVTVGSTTDEGTMASIFCRDTWQLFISPHGQIRSVLRQPVDQLQGHRDANGHQSDHLRASLVKELT